MRNFGIVDGFLIFVFSVSLVLLSFFSTIHSNFKDAISMLSFFNNARVYENLSDIAKIQIENSYPKSITQNILYTGIANKLVDTIVTPKLIELVAKPAVMASVQFARSPSAIIDDKVVVQTAVYKRQVNATISDFGLPNVLNSQLTRLVNSLPSQITLVDLQKNPNSILVVILKARALFNQNEAALSITWTILIITSILILLFNLHSIKKFMKIIWVGFGISAVFVFLLYFLVPWILELNTQTPGSILEAMQNKLVLDAVLFFMVQIRTFGILYLFVFAVFIVIYKFVKFDTFQLKFNRVLKKLHVPNIIVKSE